MSLHNRLCWFESWGITRTFYDATLDSLNSGVVFIGSGEDYLAADFSLAVASQLPFFY